MNKYFEVNCSAIKKHEGCIDKFVGDKIVAFWGLNQTPQQSAQLACESAVSQMKEMATFHAWAKKKGFPCPKIRIGICTGPMVRGIIGSKNIIDYTVIGSSVNIAERLQNKAKAFNSGILVDESTRSFNPKLQFSEIIEIVNGVSKIKAYSIIL